MNTDKLKKPFCTVVITTYNRKNLLQRALTSLIDQTEQDWEASIIDDGSEDQTFEVVKPFLQQTDRLQYYYQKNQGFINAKNVGIKKARGHYITFLDSDDEYKPDHIANRKIQFLKNPDIDLLHGGAEIIGDEYVPDSDNPDKKIHLSECAISGTFFIKNEVMQQLGGFKGTPLTTDHDFMQRAQKESIYIVKTDYPSYIYHRDVESSITLDFHKNNKTNMS